MARPLSREARRKAIEAAQELIAEHGIAGCTLEAVAKRSGVAKTTLYRHWGSGNVLLVHSIDCLIERMPTPNTGSLRNDLLEMMTMFRLAANEPAHRQMMLELVAAASKDPELAAVHRSLMHERMRPLNEVVQRAIERGEIPPIDLYRAGQFIEGPLVARMIRSQDRIEADELAPMVELITRGLGVTDHGAVDPLSAPGSEPATARP